MLAHPPRLARVRHETRDPTTRDATPSGDPEEPRHVGPLWALGKMLALPAIGVPLLVLAFEADTLSLSGWLYTASLLLCGIGLARAPRAPWRWRLGPSTIGALFFLVVAGSRIARPVDPHAHLVLGPNAPSRWSSRLFEERDAAILGARLLAASGAVEGRELARLGEVMADHYPRMPVDLGTPILATYADHQRADGFDAFVFTPAHETTRALVFLHGAGGSFALLCWQVAHVAVEAGLEAHCPAMDGSGRWNTELGRSILDAELDALAARGIEQVVLAGLSNGSLALSRMTPSLLARRGDRPPRIASLILISGVAWDAEPTALPTLLLHGARDRMTPIAPARRYAEAAGATLVELPSGHFALLEEHRRVEAALRAFLPR